MSTSATLPEVEPDEENREANITGEVILEKGRQKKKSGLITKM